VTGYIGNFVTTVESEGRLRTVEHGAAIVATGASEYRPTEYLYGVDPRVLTQLELEQRIADGDPALARAQRVVMIQCVGCREEGRNYCSRVCCGEAVKNSLKLKQQYPELDVVVLFRDIRTYGYREDHYRAAADAGVSFVRYVPEDKPQVDAETDDEGREVLRVVAPDPVLRQTLQLDADLVVLSAAMVPSASSDEIVKLFKVATNPDGFMQEAHVKLRPVDFAADGVFLAGTAHYPKHMTEAIAQAHGAAGRAATLLSQDTVKASGSVCDVDDAACVACGACISACSYGAIDFQQTANGLKARVNPVLCKGDGLCNARCATRAIRLKHFTDEEIEAQIDAALAS
jgi:heterodisulfide reductase subunit A